MGQVIAATTNAEVNVLIAQIAADFGIPEVAVLLNDADSATFSARLSAEGIDVIRAPDDLSAWASDVVAGSATLTEIPLPRRSDRSGPIPIGAVAPGVSAPLFPLVIVSNDSRSPFTLRADLAQADAVVCLRRRISGPIDDPTTSAPVPADF
jgi:hypothetical protein